MHRACALTLASNPASDDNLIVTKRKIVTWVAIVVGVLILVLALGLYLGLDAILRSRIEANATESLKLQTKLNSAKLSLLNGTLDLGNFAIASPQNFGSDVLFTMKGAKTDVSYGELRGDPIKVDQVTITNPSLVIEYNLKANRLNLQELANNVRSQPSEPSKEPVHLVIKTLRIEDPEVVVWPGIPGLTSGENLILKIPTIEMHDIGSGPDAKNGAAIREVAMDVIAAMAARAADSDKLPPGVRALLAMNAGDLSKALGAEVDKQIQGLSKTVQDTINQKIGDKIGGEIGKDAGKAVEGGLRDLTGSLQKKAGGTNKPATNPGG